MNDNYWVDDGIRDAEYALGKLRTDAETDAILGSNGPSMNVDALHPLVWGAASQRWDAGHYSDAVQRAATFLNAHVQDMTDRRDVSDSELMREAFSLSAPGARKPRLWWPGNDSDLTVKSMRVGILNLSQGVFSAIRNPATHSTEDMNVRRPSNSSRP
ncbi:TIGR02391 family protein [Agromyces sp. NPDC058126]|uniref:TIGR02391 family protein n=1 Tax=Agromyces sp. NPDC058126 TaxID=3346350 RepID=UPI0036DC1E0F